MSDADALSVALVEWDRQCALRTRPDGEPDPRYRLLPTAEATAEVERLVLIEAERQDVPARVLRGDIAAQRRTATADGAAA